MTDCPVFLEEPSPPTEAYFLSHGGASHVHLLGWLPFEYSKFYKAGCLWATPEAVTRYPNNPAVYKLLQIIFRDYGGHGRWALYNTHGVWGCYLDATPGIGLLTFKEQPDVDKIVDEMGPTRMEWFK